MTVSGKHFNKLGHESMPLVLKKHYLEVLSSFVHLFEAAIESSVLEETSKTI